MTHRRVLPLLLAVSLMAGLAAAPSQAAAPPKGKYSCIIPRLPTPFYAGYLYILSSTKYRVENEKGRYTTKGKRIIFKTGPHKGKWKKVTWAKDASGTPYITLERKEENAQAWECSRISGG
ncbi:MAG TPA: hypothetical protein VF549_10880 [Solirubrobacteraceae bacterium]